ncbi:MAG: CRISPR-associated endonuclease Cas2 [Thermoprotei archaeon]
MPEGLVTLVIYDITEDDVRLRVSKFLRAKGLSRIQKSAYIGWLNVAQRKDVENGLARLIQGKKANVQLFPLTPASYNQRVSLGVELKYDDNDRLIA